MQILEKFSQFYDDRSAGSVVDTVVVHSMFNPRASSPIDLQACVDVLNFYEVSAHYLIARDGIVWQLVPDEKRAWHAGKSLMHDGREGVNHFSVGIELLNNAKDQFTEIQYQTLAQLLVQLTGRFSLRFVVGHEHIAQPLGKKTDPGELFDWNYLKALLEKNTATAQLQFPFYKPVAR